MSAQAIKKADEAVQAAYTTVQQWEDKAREARSKAADLEADSGRDILAGASAHEIAVKINAADLEAKAYDNAAAEARVQLGESRTAMLEAHAADYEQRTKKALHARDQMDEKADALKAQLHELTGEDWGIVTPPLKVGESRLVSAYDKVHGLPQAFENQAAWIRFFLANGTKPKTVADLNEHGGHNHPLLFLWDVISEAPEVFARLDELEAESGLNAPESAPAEKVERGSRLAQAPHDEDDISAFDPVEDADLISRMGISK